MLGRDQTSTPASTATPFAIYKRELDARTTVVSVEGELDLSTAPRLKWMLTDALGSGAQRVLVDLSRVGFMDSTALGVLVAAQRKLGADERLAIVCSDERVRQIFEFSGIDGAFAISSTLEQALERLDAEAAPAP